MNIPRLTFGPPRQCRPLVVAAAISLCLSSGAAEPTLFERDVQPFLTAKCGRCHGEKARKADLDVVSFAGIMRGGESGPVIAAGKPHDSAVYEKTSTGEMPPDGENMLSDEELAILDRWIAGGAKSAAKTAAAVAAPSQHDVLPIFLLHCTKCHGRYRQDGKLDLRSYASLMRGGKSGPVIVPGKPDESLLVQRIAAGEMPPNKQLVAVSVKPVESGELEQVRTWIAAGAPEGTVQPDVPNGLPDPLVSEEERKFWSFQPPRRPPLPAVKDESLVRTPVDAFVLAKLEAAGLPFAPEADRPTLLRRLSFDLTGLPPTPEENAVFVADPSPDAYEKLVDRLLASPRYGERWGRYWLDLAGYADTEGKREQDLPRPHAWRYRDYVIRAFNADKPYDRFLVEQLAGDELADWRTAPHISQEMEDNLVATGFLRMVPDPTWANLTGYVPDRMDVIADELDVLGSGVMGLSIKCARCHSHKFDPIPQRDYFRLAAIFKGALDEHDWLKPQLAPGQGGAVSTDVAPGRLLDHVATAETVAWKAAGGTPAGRPQIQGVWDRGEPSPTYIHRRGDPTAAGTLVGPAPPSVLTDGKTPLDIQPPWPGAPSTGRRLAFAKWLTRPDNPLVARVAVNRVWMHHFGAGLVETVGNFGTTGTPPTHPELLDWLACEFVERGWSLKAMHRLLVTSRTYRQRSDVSAEQARLDPENALLSRMPLVKLDAEALYDALLAAAGRLDTTPFGPADPVEARPDGLVAAKSTPAGWRRLLYVTQARKKVMLHMELFDYPQMNPNCLERRSSMVAPQALHLMNNGMVSKLAADFAARIERDAGVDPDRQIERAWLIAYGCPPTADEVATSRQSLERLAREWATAKQPPEAARGKALADYCHALLNSARFVFVD
ncbi:MAG: PSD1 and planctomycete cytochrome C domain-containing protein [Pirellulales bacterium]